MAPQQQVETQQVEKPKKAKSAYFLFCDAKRPATMEANRAKNGGKLKMTELGKELSELWKQAGEEEKAKFEALAAEEKTRHDAAKKEYEEATKIEGLMKRPQSEYFQFINANRTKIMEEHKITGIAEVGKKAAELWKNMSDEEKKPYGEQYAKDKAAYEAWRETDAGKEALAKQKSMKASSGDSAKAKTKEKATPKKEKKEKEAKREKKVSPKKAAKAKVSPKKAAKAKASPKKAGAKKRAAPATSPAKEAPPAGAKRGRKAVAAANAAVEAKLSDDILAKCASMGVADSGVSYKSLLEKLLATNGLADVDQDKALQTIQQNGGLLNRARPALLGTA